jgi:1,4-alpha-glucan branching enzyme
MFAHPGKKLLFMGGEFGQWVEWNHNQSLDWHLLDSPLHGGVRRLIQHLNHLYTNEPVFWELDDSYEGFEWVDFHDSDNSVVAFLRKAKSGPTFLFVVNATPVPRHAYRVGAPGEGWYEEILNTDAETYGGSNGDIIVADESGIVIVQTETAHSILAKAEERCRKEAAIMDELRGGRTTIELLGLDEKSAEG